MASTQVASDMAAQLRQQWKPGSQTYVVIDAAQDYAPIVVLRDQFGQSPQNLFPDDYAPALADVAPYVSPIDLAGDFLAYWCELWGTNQGVLLATSADMETLLAHLRTIFEVTDDQTGEESFHRFYDPRVLREHAAACPADEAREFFGPITSWCVEDDPATSATILQLGADGVESRKLALSTTQQDTDEPL